MGKLDGRVAFITGAARGQGRSHAVRLAEEGADILAVDICAQIDSVPYPLASAEDLAQTVEEVKATGRRVFSRQVDVRDRAALQDAFNAGASELGVPDIVLANAGVAPLSVREAPREWEDVIAVNLTGAFNTVEVAVPSMIEAGRGGAIVLTSSTAGMSGMGSWSPGSLGYVASKHGVVGLMRSYSNSLSEYSIRVNTIHPTGVRTGMVINDAVQEYLAARPYRSTGRTNALPIDILEPVEVSNAIVWLVSDDARYVTGITLPVDAGFLNKR